MIVTEQLFKIEDQVETLVQTILSSKTANEYLQNREAMYDSEDVVQKQKNFLQAKESFERVEAYGIHAPDFREKQRAVRQAKRALDLSEEVAQFRVAETKLQGVLDEIGLTIAATISDSIKVDAGNPFFNKGNHGCGGSCHAS